jgi:hypothetical protein
MTKEEILKWATKIKHDDNDRTFRAYVAEIKELIKSYAGKNNAYYEELDSIPRSWLHEIYGIANGILKRFINAIENDLLSNQSIERKIQSEVVNDFLEQAQFLLDDSKVHPGAPAMIIGAALEEFLRNWVEEQGLSIEDNKPTIDTYAKLLKQNELLTKQDMKDITSWAGIRNDAAHGKWDDVKDRNRIRLMLESVNYFLRVKTE